MAQCCIAAPRRCEEGEFGDSTAWLYSVLLWLPARLVALGYAGWEAGQLEQEIRQNAWLTVPASSNLVFDTPYEQRWSAAAESIGIDPASLSLHAGNA